MRRIIVSEFLTMDGVMEEPQWTVPFNTKEQNEHKLEELKACEALLLGRVTYEGFAAAWPQVEKTNTVRNPVRDFTIPDGFAERMNRYPKYVISRTRTDEEMTWNARLLKGDAAEAIRQLKAQPGGDLLVVGSRELVHTLMAHDLVDEYRLMVFPVVLGSGRRLFKDGAATKTLRLDRTHTFRSGAVELTYRLAR